MNTLLTRLALAGLGLNASIGAASADSFLIVPGRSIGRTALGPNGAAELSRLPKASASDNGMQQTRLVWASPASRDTLYIHGINNSVEDDLKPTGGTSLNEIRVTSRRFHTANGISTASTLAQVRRRFPDARRRFPDARPMGGAPNLYDDKRHGIAFEFAQPVLPSSRCIGVSVIKPLPHGSGDGVTAQSEVDNLLRNAPSR